MSFEPRDYLRHMLDEVRFLTAESSQLTLSDLKLDELRQRAFLRSLEILGEAAKKMPSDFREAHPEIEWRSMAGMRDHLIHGYFNVDLEIVWDAIQMEIPLLLEHLQALLDKPNLEE